MNVLVAGATGFVGANVTRLLVADGYRVRALSRPTSALQALAGCRVEIFRGDILDPDALAPATATWRSGRTPSASIRIASPRPAARCGPPSPPPR